MQLVRDYSRYLKLANYSIKSKYIITCTGADPGFFLGGGAPLRKTLLTGEVKKFLKRIRRRRLHTRGSAHPLHPPPRFAPDVYVVRYVYNYKTSHLNQQKSVYVSVWSLTCNRPSAYPSLRPLTHYNDQTLMPRPFAWCPSPCTPVQLSHSTNMKVNFQFSHTSDSQSEAYLGELMSLVWHIFCSKAAFTQQT